MWYILGKLLTAAPHCIKNVTAATEKQKKHAGVKYRKLLAAVKLKSITSISGQSIKQLSLHGCKKMVPKNMETETSKSCWLCQQLFWQLNFIFHMTAAGCRTETILKAIVDNCNNFQNALSTLHGVPCLQKWLQYTAYFLYYSVDG